MRKFPNSAAWNAIPGKLLKNYYRNHRYYKIGVAILQILTALHMGWLNFTAKIFGETLYITIIRTVITTMAAQALVWVVCRGLWYLVFFRFITHLSLQSPRVDPRLIRARADAVLWLMRLGAGRMLLGAAIIGYGVPLAVYSGALR